MSSSVEVNGLSKNFKITTEPTTLFRLCKRFINRKPSSREIWALKDINFEIKKGEKIGLIGDNGSGKTTLLRVVSGIYQKTSGIVNIRGPMFGFLQLGVGMRRDLSALDNIYFFGAIIGFNRDYVTKRLERIIQFSGLGDFLYSPLNDFSTGMVQRLAVSILNELTPDVLLLDEVLSNGDASFKEKFVETFGKNGGSSGVLIMSSHDMSLVAKVCDKALLLDKGKQIAFGPVDKIIDIYTNRRF